MDDSVVVLGSCSLDYTVYAPRLPKPGETIHGTKFSISYGGKGANQCMAAKKLGSNTTMIAKVGDDAGGEDYIKYFKNAGIDTEFMKPTPNICTGMAQITVGDRGENQITIVAGANGKLSTSDVEAARTRIESAKILLCQLETPMDATLAAFKMCKGVSPIRLLNAAPAVAGIDELLKSTDILCVNESEASLIANVAIDSDESIVRALDVLRKHCDTVIITLGAKGAAFASTKSPVPTTIPCPTVAPADSTGAGDAFCGALAAALARTGASLAEAIAAACAVASESVTKLGTQTSYPEAPIEDYIPKDAATVRA